MREEDAEVERGVGWAMRRGVWDGFVGTREGVTGDGRKMWVGGRRGRERLKLGI